MDLLNISDFNQLSREEKVKKYDEIKVHLPLGILNAFFVEALENNERSVFLAQDVVNEDLVKAYKYFNNDRYLSSESLSYLKQIMIYPAILKEIVAPINNVLDIDYDIVMYGKALKNYLIEKHDVENIDLLININKVNGFNPDFINNKEWLLKDISPFKENLDSLSSEELLEINEDENYSFNIISILRKKELILNKLNLKEYFNEVNNGQDIHIDNNTPIQTIQEDVNNFIQNLFITLIFKKIKYNEVNTTRLLNIREMFQNNMIVLGDNSKDLTINDYLIKYPLCIKVKTNSLLFSEIPNEEKIKLSFNKDESILEDFLNNFKIELLLKIPNKIKISLKFLKDLI